MLFSYVPSKYIRFMGFVSCPTILEYSKDDIQSENKSLRRISKKKPSIQTNET
jgi:hypothetical protein